MCLLFILCLHDDTPISSSVDIYIVKLLAVSQHHLHQLCYIIGMTLSIICWQKIFGNYIHTEKCSQLWWLWKAHILLLNKIAKEKDICVKGSCITEKVTWWTDIIGILKGGRCGFPLIKGLALGSTTIVTLTWFKMPYHNRLFRACYELQCRDLKNEKKGVKSNVLSAYQGLNDFPLVDEGVSTILEMVKKMRSVQGYLYATGKPRKLKRHNWSLIHNVLRQLYSCRFVIQNRFRNQKNGPSCY